MKVETANRNVSEQRIIYEQQQLLAHFVLFLWDAQPGASWSGVATCPLNMELHFQRRIIKMKLGIGRKTNL